MKYSALHAAAVFGHVDVCELLLDGAFRTAWTYWTSVTVSLLCTTPRTNGRRDVVELLLDRPPPRSPGDGAAGWLPPPGLSARRASEKLRATTPRYVPGPPGTEGRHHQRPGDKSLLYATSYYNRTLRTSPSPPVLVTEAPRIRVSRCVGSAPHPPRARGPLAELVLLSSARASAACRLFDPLATPVGCPSTAAPRRSERRSLALLPSGERGGRHAPAPLPVLARFVAHGAAASLTKPRFRNDTPWSCCPRARRAAQP